MDLTPGVCDGFVLNGPRPLDERLALARAHLRPAGRHPPASTGPASGSATCSTTRASAPPRAALDHWEGTLRRVQLEPAARADLRDGLAARNTPPPARSPSSSTATSSRATSCWTATGCRPCSTGRPPTSVTRTRISAGSPTRCGPVSTRSPGRGSRPTCSPAGRAATGMDGRRRRCVHWWQVLANVKLAVIVLTGVRAFVGGPPRPDPPAAGVDHRPPPPTDRSVMRPTVDEQLRGHRCRPRRCRRARSSTTPTPPTCWPGRWPPSGSWPTDWPRRCRSGAGTPRRASPCFGPPRVEAPAPPRDPLDLDALGAHHQEVRALIEASIPAIRQKPEADRALVALMKERCARYPFAARYPGGPGAHTAR